MWNKSIFNGVIGFMVLYSSEVIIILFPYKALHDGWSSSLYDEFLHCFRYAWGFRNFQVFEYYLKRTFLTEISMFRFWILHWRLLRNDCYKGSYQADGLKWCKIVFQMVNSWNLLGIFKPDLLCSIEQLNYFNI